RGDTSPVEANAAQGFPLYNGGLKTKLGCPDGRNITARSAPNYNDVVVHILFCFLRLISMYAVSSILRWLQTYVFFEKSESRKVEKSATPANRHILVKAHRK